MRTSSPIRVDADRRPDIAERYSLGGWPTTAFLTPDGDVLGGGTFVERQRLADVLRARVGGVRAGARRLRAGAQPAGARRRPRRDCPAGAADRRSSTAAFDPRHGGFGGAPKFPHAAPVRLALHLYREQAIRAHRDIAITTLDAMGWGPLYDEKDGGFFRYARRADWGEPNGEKLLDVNASLLDLYVDAAETLELARYARAGRGHPALRADLARRSGRRRMGGVAARRSRLPRRLRATRSRSGRDRRRSIARSTPDWNAMMASAAIKAGRALNDAVAVGVRHPLPRTHRAALLPARRRDGALPRRRGRGCAACSTIRSRWPPRSSTRSRRPATSSIEMLAEELALHAVEPMWDERRRRILRSRRRIRRRTSGLLGERRKPFAANCAAARLLRSARPHRDKPRYRELAERTLVGHRPARRRRGAAGGRLRARRQGRRPVINCAFASGG